jgi:hypothetical protein
MFTPKMPISEYASSSTQVIVRFDAHDIRLATENTTDSTSLSRSLFGIPVISLMAASNLRFSEIRSHSLEKNMTVAGAINSCKVQPRVNHRPLLKVSMGSVNRTSERSAKQTAAFAYHNYIKLRASDSSALNFLSIQQVLIQKYS